MSDFKRYTSYLGIKLQWERRLKINCSTLVSHFRHITRWGIFDRHKQGITELAGAGQLQSLEPTGSAQVAQSHWAGPVHLGLHIAKACQGTPELQTRLSLSSQHSYNLNSTGFLSAILHIMSTCIHPTF